MTAAVNWNLAIVDNTPDSATIAMSSTGKRFLTTSCHGAGSAASARTCDPRTRPANAIGSAKHAAATHSRSTGARTRERMPTKKDPAEAPTPPMPEMAGYRRRACLASKARVTSPPLSKATTTPKPWATRNSTKGPPLGQANTIARRTTSVAASAPKAIVEHCRGDVRRSRAPCAKEATTLSTAPPMKM